MNAHPTPDDELHHRERVADQMLTGHAELRDRFLRRARVLDVGLFGASTLLLATVFFDPVLLGIIHMGAGVWRVLTGLLSMAVFFFSFVALLVDWKERAGRHQQAVKALADVKAKARELLNPDAGSRAAESWEFLRASALVMRELEPIPEAEFQRLKARHKLKVEVSRMLDRHPGAPAWLLRWILRMRDSRHALRHSDA